MRTYFFIFSCTFIFIAKAQSTYKIGLFPTIDHSGKLTKNLEYGLYYFAAVPMYGIKPISGLNAKAILLYSENGLTYHFNNRFGITAAYVFQKENPSEINYANENRIHFQMHYKLKRKDFEFKNRLRFDYRSVKYPNVQSTEITHRLRYLLGYSRYFKSSEKYYYSLYEELFFNTKPITKGGLSENWSSFIVGMKVNETHKLETGPLYITWKTNNYSWFNQFYWQITWVSQLDFTK